MSNVKLFTHTDLDGIGCAVLAYLAFGRENVDVEYCDYKNVNEKVEDFYLNERDKIYDAAFITDISVNEEVAEQIDLIVKVDGKWQLIDHHATALGLNKYKWCDVSVEDYLGVKTSGTMMFYWYLNSKGYFKEGKYSHRICNNIFNFARTVRDYDTWRWKEELGEGGVACKQLNDLFHIYGRNEFIEWALDNIFELDNVPYFLEKDRALLEQKQKDIDNYISQKNKQLVSIEDNFGYKCGVVFADRYLSELGNKLSELHPELDYISMIDIGNGGVSYRTVREDIDLGGEIAHSFGGGGHRNAAGSSFDGERVRRVVMKELFLV